MPDQPQGDAGSADPRRHVQADATLLRQRRWQAPVQVRRPDSSGSATTWRRSNRATARHHSLEPALTTLAGAVDARHLRLLRSAQQRGQSEAGPHHGRRRQLNNLGLFVQDAWTINNKLTLNLGVRTETEARPDLRYRRDIPESASSSASATSWRRAPASRMTSRATAAGRSYGSWGVFYDIFKLELPRGSFGGDKWLVVLLHARHLQLADRWSTATNCPPACTGTTSADRSNIRHPSFADAIDPDLKPMQQQEAGRSASTTS